jgi:hypothetical protein
MYSGSKCGIFNGRGIKAVAECDHDVEESQLPICRSSVLSAGRGDCLLHHVKEAQDVGSWIDHAVILEPDSPSARWNRTVHRHDAEKECSRPIAVSSGVVGRFEPFVVEGNSRVGTTCCS